MKSRNFGIFYSSSQGAFCIKPRDMVCPIAGQKLNVNPKLAIRLEYSTSSKSDFGSPGRSC